MSEMVEAVIFDYNRTLVTGDESPPQLFPDTSYVLQLLRDRGIQMALVSVSDNPELRQHEFDQLELATYISYFMIVGKNDRKNLQPVLDWLQVSAEACIVVGDRVKKEITEGNTIGATTVWLQQGKFATELPNEENEYPDYIIQTLSQLINIIDIIDLTDKKKST
jgi:FMN phosphatase YigB (HAD superfamily)